MDHKNSTTLGVIIFFGVLAFGATLFGACNVPSDKATRVLHGAGYSDVRLLGHAWFACSDDDALSTGFSAEGPSGERVEGAVCCGLMLKDCTIRTSGTP
jgi:hypothetical protein